LRWRANTGMRTCGRPRRRRRCRHERRNAVHYLPRSGHRGHGAVQWCPPGASACRGRGVPPPAGTAPHRLCSAVQLRRPGSRLWRADHARPARMDPGGAPDEGGNPTDGVFTCRVPRRLRALRRRARAAARGIRDERSRHSRHRSPRPRFATR
jgi:hypothetical protein